MIILPLISVIVVQFGGPLILYLRELYLIKTGYYDLNEYRESKIGKKAIKSHTFIYVLFGASMILFFQSLFITFLPVSDFLIFSILIVHGIYLSYCLYYIFKITNLDVLGEDFDDLSIINEDTLYGKKIKKYLFWSDLKYNENLDNNEHEVAIDYLKKQNIDEFIRELNFVVENLVNEFTKENPHLSVRVLGFKLLNELYKIGLPEELGENKVNNNYKKRIDHIIDMILNENPKPNPRKMGIRIIEKVIDFGLLGTIKKEGVKILGINLFTHLLDNIVEVDPQINPKDFCFKLLEKMYLKMKIEVKIEETQNVINYLSRFKASKSREDFENKLDNLKKLYKAIFPYS